MFPETLMKLKQLPSRERERKKEEIYLQRCLLRERRKRLEAGGLPDSATFPGPSSALILSLVAMDHLSSPLKSTEVHMASSPQGWGMLVLSPLIVWRGGRTRQQGGVGVGGTGFYST